jgi:acetylornithine/succinyldiaminopimelate/putrescine aminotransferase
VLALAAGPTVLRLLPPLVITRGELDTAVDGIASALAWGESL